MSLSPALPPAPLPSPTSSQYSTRSSRGSCSSTGSNGGGYKDGSSLSLQQIQPRPTTSSRYVLANNAHEENLWETLHHQTATQDPAAPTMLSGDKENYSKKPPVSYACMIVEVFEESNNRLMSLAEIYHHICQKYPFFQTAPPGWKNSIRHNLSLHPFFARVARPPNVPGKGSFWKLATGASDELPKNVHHVAHSMPKDVHTVFEDDGLAGFWPSHESGPMGSNGPDGRHLPDFHRRQSVASFPVSRHHPYKKTSQEEVQRSAHPMLPPLPNPFLYSLPPFYGPAMFPMMPPPPPPRHGLYSPAMVSHGLLPPGYPPQLYLPPQWNPLGMIHDTNVDHHKKLDLPLGQAVLVSPQVPFEPIDHGPDESAIDNVSYLHQQRLSSLLLK